MFKKEKTYTIKELCRALRLKGRRVTVSMLIKYIKKGDIKAIKVKGKYFIKESDIDWNISTETQKSFYENKYYDNKDQGINQALASKLNNGGTKATCSICGCELLKRNIRCDERGYAFCRECFFDTH